MGSSCCRHRSPDDELEEIEMLIQSSRSRFADMVSQMKPLRYRVSCKNTIVAYAPKCTSILGRAELTLFLKNASEFYEALRGLSGELDNDAFYVFVTHGEVWQTHMAHYVYCTEDHAALDLAHKGWQNWYMTLVTVYEVKIFNPLKPSLSINRVKPRVGDSQKHPPVPVTRPPTPPSPSSEEDAVPPFTIEDFPAAPRHTPTNKPPNNGRGGGTFPPLLAEKRPAQLLLADE